MRMIYLLLMLFVSGCGQLVATETETAQCHAASELALFQRDGVTPVEPTKPVVEPQKNLCQCNGTKFVNDRSSGKLRRIACPCGQSCKCIGAAFVEETKRPEVIFWTRRGCAPCKAILAELKACEAELPFVIVSKDDTHKQPDWLPSWPTLHWSIGFDEWKAFSPNAETPWPGVDGFVTLWRKSFPQVAAPMATGPPAGIGAGKFPIRATIQQIKQLLSAKGLALPYGLTVRAPTHGLIASVSQAGENVVIEFDESTLPAVSFNGKVRRATIGEQRGSIVIDGLPDVSFEVTP